MADMEARQARLGLGVAVTAAHEGDEPDFRLRPHGDRAHAAGATRDDRGLDRIDPRAPDEVEAGSRERRSHRPIALDETDIDGILDVPGQEIAGAVEGIDEEEQVRGRSVVSALLRHNRDAGPMPREGRQDQLLRGVIGDTRRRSVRLDHVRAVSAVIGTKDLAGLASDLGEDGRDPLAVLCRKCHPADMV